MSELGVWFNGFLWVVAESAEDAVQVAADDANAFMFYNSKWIRWDDSRTVKVIEYDGTITTKTCAEWAKQGRGFLCSTEYLDDND